MNQKTTDSLEHHLVRLFGRINYERQLPVTPRHFKLQNMGALLKLLGDPHLQYPVIHVAGTKGKGSVATMAGAILSASECKTGVYTSPHLESIHQRVKVDGLMITDEELMNLLRDLEPAAEELDRQALAENRRPLTFFEVTSAAAFFHFARTNVDAAVIEVGLGGRLDSTNICEPTVCVITNISLDHTKQLGDTLEEIAGEKAGIIKRNIPVVSGAVNPKAAKVIEKFATENEAPLFVLDRDFHASANESGTFEYQTSVQSPLIGEKLPELSGLKTRMLGAHQVQNAALAISAVRLLGENVTGISEGSIREGLKKAHLAGRTEKFVVAVDGDTSQLNNVLLDMAHNAASVSALVETLENQLETWDSATARRLILASSRDKDALAMIQQLVGKFDEIVLTRYCNNPRAKDPQELLEIAIRLRDQLNLATKLSVQATPEAAWQHLCGNSDGNEFICIAGSAFLAAELRPTVILASIES